MNDAVDQQHAAEEDGEHEEIERLRRTQIEEPEQMSARPRLDAVLAAGARRLQREKIDPLRDGARDHGDIDADRKTDAPGKSVLVSVDLGGRRSIKKTQNT